MVTLQPGVVNQMGDETSAGNTAMSVNGARTTANNWTVDGADINDSGSNGTVINEPNVDAIQEFTLQRGNYDAGYGRSGGGQVLVATKIRHQLVPWRRVRVCPQHRSSTANEWFNKRTQAENNEPNKNPVNHHNVLWFHNRRPDLHSQGLQHRQEEDLLLLVRGMAQDLRSRRRPCRRPPQPN